MRQTEPVTRIQTVARGRVPASVVDYAREKTAALTGLVREPIPFVRLMFAQSRDPAVRRPAAAQALLDLDGRLVHAHAAAATMREAVDQLMDRLHRRLASANEHWEARRGARPGPGSWRHDSEPARRPEYYPRPVAEREIVPHMSFARGRETPDEAVSEMEALEYDFHLFTDSVTGLDSVVYRAGPAGFRLAQSAPGGRPGPFAVPMTVSTAPVPVLPPDQAAERLENLGLPFLFFVDPATGRADLVYHRYDGHYGLITPSDGDVDVGGREGEGAP